MDKNRDDHAIMANVIKSLERGDSFSSSDRAKFAQATRTHGIKIALLKRLLTSLRPLVLSISMKIGLMQAICQENKRKPCVLSFKKALMKI